MNCPRSSHPEVGPRSSASTRWRTAGSSGRSRLIPGLTVLTKKPVTATAQEVAVNPRARSAKLRVAERCPNQAGTPRPILIPNPNPYPEPGPRPRRI